MDECKSLDGSLEPSAHRRRSGVDCFASYARSRRTDTTHSSSPGRRRWPTLTGLEVCIAGGQRPLLMSAPNVGVETGS